MESAGVERSGADGADGSEGEIETRTVELADLSGVWRSTSYMSLTAGSTTLLLISELACESRQQYETPYYTCLFGCGVIK